jgi:hypothetical protein
MLGGLCLVVNKSTSSGKIVNIIAVDPSE